MEIKINLIIICTLLLISCYNTRADIDNQTELKLPNENQWSVGLKDTTLKECIGNLFVAYHLQGDSIYSIEWGCDSIRNTSTQKFEVLGNGILRVLKNNENYILLSQSCGQRCEYYVFLPLKNNAIEKVYFDVLANDLENNLVAYVPEDNNEVFVRVENYLTGQTMDIKETNLCPAYNAADCIDSVYFNKSSLVLKWQGSKWNNNQTDLQEKEIPLPTWLRLATCADTE